MMPADRNPLRYSAKTSPRYFTVPSNITSVDPAISGATKDIYNEYIGTQHKNGIDGLLAVFRGSQNLELLTERLTNHCDHLLMIVSQHHANLIQCNSPRKRTRDEIVLFADLSPLSFVTVTLRAIFN
jgi:hypothetical protein